MAFQNTISGKDFCKKNCGSVSKDKFYEEYYRIIHTAYLRANGESCIEVIKRDFIENFGTELDNISISYIYATAKYLVYDVVISSLLGDGKIDSQYYFNKLVIDLGFDVWLIRSIEAGTKVTINDFIDWQPLGRTDRVERAINDFWTYRLPKSHNFGHLYSGISEYKKVIFETYRRLLRANNEIELDETATKNILEYLDAELSGDDDYAKIEAAANAIADAIENKTAAAVTEETAETAEVAVTEETADIEEVAETEETADTEEVAVTEEIADAEEVAETEETAETEEVAVTEEIAESTEIAVDDNVEITESTEATEVIETAETTEFTETADDIDDTEVAEDTSRSFSEMLEDAENKAEKLVEEIPEALAYEVVDSINETEYVADVSDVMHDDYAESIETPANINAEVVAEETAEETTEEIKEEITEETTEETTEEITEEITETVKEPAPMPVIRIVDYRAAAEVAQKKAKEAQQLAAEAKQKVSKQIKGFNEEKSKMTKKKALSTAIRATVAVGVVVAPVALAILGKGRKK